MTDLRAELSSLSSSLAELTRRVSAAAEEANRGDHPGDDGAGAADLAAELFTVERSLKGALRRLERASSLR